MLTSETGYARSSLCAALWSFYMFYFILFYLLKLLASIRLDSKMLTKSCASSSVIIRGKVQYVHNMHKLPFFCFYFNSFVLSIFFFISMWKHKLRINPTRLSSSQYVIQCKSLRVTNLPLVKNWHFFFFQAENDVQSYVWKVGGVWESCRQGLGSIHFPLLWLKYGDYCNMNHYKSFSYRKFHVHPSH